MYLMNKGGQWLRGIPVDMSGGAVQPLSPHGSNRRRERVANAFPHGTDRRLHGTPRTLVTQDDLGEAGDGTSFVRGRKTRCGSVSRKADETEGYKSVELIAPRPWKDSAGFLQEAEGY